MGRGGGSEQRKGRSWRRNCIVMVYLALSGRRRCSLAPKALRRGGRCRRVVVCHVDVGSETAAAPGAAGRRLGREEGEETEKCTRIWGSGVQFPRFHGQGGALYRGYVEFATFVSHRDWGNTRTRARKYQKARDLNLFLAHLIRFLLFLRTKCTFEHLESVLLRIGVGFLDSLAKVVRRPQSLAESTDATGHRKECFTMSFRFIDAALPSITSNSSWLRDCSARINNGVKDLLIDRSSCTCKRPQDH